MVELLLPGHTAAEIILAVVLGVAGALLARYIGGVTGWLGTEQPESYVASIAVLLVYGAFFRGPRRRRD